MIDWKPREESRTITALADLQEGRHFVIFNETSVSGDDGYGNHTSTPAVSIEVFKTEDLWRQAVEIQAKHPRVAYTRPNGWKAAIVEVPKIEVSISVKVASTEAAATKWPGGPYDR